ncbi:uncharacterized protein PGTG_15604 [Puccinia graminis f. sp. tritici CRL 75-36-700-3]|uniref:Serine/threonine-protein phosphatase 2A activator n=1 Tax=Puccinia graminis f. sp. tritici (strain CRL 75-36-700-3 / race SCCL) TaxID=418459 RepID=E3KZB6_PUCGT|nr:uncharacterized protein PGTG_15604 [Puccinia graminis f. sp. tritici CRL 75-36-700-3]EFP89641.2 hypothetical protein PGTG_15604 [Puccinia graminis f. sp. tritici CRL 75-36-700-3]
MDTNTEPVNPHTKQPETITRSITKPRKLIISNVLRRVFIDPVTLAEVVEFIESLNQSIIDLPLDRLLPLSENIDKLLDILDNINNIALVHPPVDNKPSRSGNPAFREFHDQLNQGSEALQSLLDIPEDKRVERSTYLTVSEENQSRIDYGSEVELNFLCGLLCPYKLKGFGSDYYPTVVLEVFCKYIELMRYLQSTYWLESAGSHGVWGLDDYHFLCGTGQLRNHKYLKPKSIRDPDASEGFSHQFQITTASLRWNSPMLDDISEVKTWDKVISGLIRMYKAEVLTKLPVAQHFLFGTLLPFPDTDIQKVESFRNRRSTKDRNKQQITESNRCYIRPFRRVKLLSTPWMVVPILMLICLNTVQSNTLIESFGVPRNQKEEFQIDRFLLIKHSDSNEGSKNSWEDEGQSDWEGRIRGIIKESGDRLEDGQRGRTSTEEEPSTESTETVSIKPNRSSRLRLKLSRTTDPQKFSYLFLIVPMDERLRRSTGQAKEKLFDPFSNSIDHSANALRRFFGAPPLEEQRFSVRFSWDASDHVDLHLDLDHSPSDLITISSSNPAFFNLTITPNFDKFSDSHSTQTDSFVDLIVIIEPLLLNLLPIGCLCCGPTY